MILQLSDFQAGLTKVAGDQYTDADFQSFLTQANEKKYIFQIFGATLGQEFLDDLSGTPSIPNTAKWQTVFNQFDYEAGSLPVNCIGIKQILVYLFYNDYVSQQPVQNTITGNNSVRAEAMDRANIVQKTTVIYNRGVYEIEKLQHYVTLNSTDYQNFNGVLFPYQSAL